LIAQDARDFTALHRKRLCWITAAKSIAFRQLSAEV
jgi:hypothetical protein